MHTAVVTGANRGIGLEICRQLKSKGMRVIAVCRAASEELGELGLQIIEGIDQSSDAGVADLAGKLGSVEVDLLINNAGILRQESLEDMNFDGMRMQFEVNALGPLRITHALLPMLKDGAKVAIVTSRMGSIADNTSGSRYGYRMSKAAVNMAATSLAHDLRGRGIAVALLHPGYVRTDMTAHSGLIDAPEAAEGMLKRVDALSLADSGGFWHSNGERLAW